MIFRRPAMPVIRGTAWSACGRGHANWKKRAVSLGRRPNADYRERERLTTTEIEKLIEAAKGNRYGHRDPTGRAHRAWNGGWDLAFAA